jgi:hypothetical protein
MVKYLLQLLGDIEQSIELASQLPEQDWFPDYEDEEEETSLVSTKAVKLGDIYDIPFEAFPPEKLLSDVQVIQLLDGIQRLWSSWRLWCDLPRQLTDRQHYSAMLHAMQHELVAWNVNKGGDVAICRFEEGSYCPFGKDGHYCQCRVLDETVKHDIAIWEEHVRSQGLDPYRELSEEEGAAFEEEMRIRNLRRHFGDDWEKHDRFEPYLEIEAEDEEYLGDELDEADSFDDWTEGFIWEDEHSKAPSDGLEDNSPKDYDIEKPKGSIWDENEFDLPFF